MNQKALHTLEFDKIRDKLTSHAATPMGKEEARALTPSDDFDIIVNAQKETSEAVSMILKKGSLSLGGLKDIRPSLQRTAVDGVLSIEELLYVGDFLYTARRAKSYARSENKNDSFPLLEPMFDSVETADKLEREIERCIASNDDLNDDASSKLREIRINIKRSNDRIREQLNTIIHSQNYKTMLQDPVITIRNERFCVPVKAEYKNAFLGMIHDQSSTGSTVFIEPMSIVSLNNKIKELHAEEKLEIKKILTNLSRMVEENRDILQTDLNILSHIDFIFAKGELSLSMNGTEPKFNQKGYINIKKARHPLLDPSAVVATDIYLGDEFTTLLITGPNTGGKTVSLKTIGLFTLMGQAGLHISAFDNSELCVFDDVFSDIGDEQSIEQSLSTFSSHMSNIVKILENVTDNSLVLIDELGAGTDPTEGAALATAIIGYLHDREIRTVVTTHYSELKVYAISTDGIENASCEFDVETLRPTYKLLIGVPGKSNAFAISSRLGLPDFIINDAKELLSHEDKRFEDVITDLEISRKNLVTEQEKAEEYRLEAQRLKKEVEERKRKTKEQRDKILKEANETARKIISDAKDESDSIIKQMQKMLKDNTPLHELDEMRQKLNTKLKDSDEKLQKLDKKKKQQRYEPPVPSEIKKGDRIYLHSLEQSGYVETLPNSKNELMVRIGALNMKVNIKDISMDRTKVKEEKQKNSYSVKTSGIKAQHVSAEVDLRGLMVYEAIEKLDKYLDDAYLSHLTPVTVIHGKGTGALRSAVTDFLRKNRHVKSFRLGQYGEGETGVTIVELN